MLLKIILNLEFLGRQGNALCGHEEEESNFMQLFKLCELDNLILSAWLKKSGDKYSSSDIQNEILEVSILHSIACQLQSSSMFAVMADECVDVANHEQLAMCFRWVDASLNVHEEFIGLYHISDISANTIVHAIKDCLLRLNLQWCRCRRQCFDSASNKVGHRMVLQHNCLLLRREHFSLTATAILSTWLFVTLSKSVR